MNHKTGVNVIAPKKSAGAKAPSKSVAKTPAKKAVKHAAAPSPAKTAPSAKAPQKSATRIPAKSKGKADERELVDALVAILDESKAEDIVIVPLAGKSSIADFMIIATGRSGRHVAALADMVGDYLFETSGRHARYEGKGNGDWVLADAGDVIVHLFRPEVRSFYNIEKIWCAPAEPGADTKATPKKRKAKEAA